MNRIVHFLTHRDRAGATARQLVEAGLIAFLVIIFGIVAYTISGRPAQAGSDSATGSADSWWAEPVVISLDATASGISLYESAWNNMPHLVVYADGLVIGVQYEYHEGTKSRLLWQAELTQAELCRLLFQIEDLGFLAYNTEDYVAPYIYDASSTHILVQAWQANEIFAYALGFDPVGPADRALTDTFRLLRDYRPEETIPYQAERIALLPVPMGDTADSSALDVLGGNLDTIAVWPYETPTLREISVGPRSERGQQIFSGAQARELQNLFQSDYYHVFRENDQYYDVYLRPVLPYEVWPNPTSVFTVSEFETTPKTDMWCALPAVATDEG